MYMVYRFIPNTQYYLTERPTITSSPSTQVAYEGDIVTLSCSAIDMTNIEWLAYLSYYNIKYNSYILLLLQIYIYEYLLYIIILFK